MKFPGCSEKQLVFKPDVTVHSSHISHADINGEDTEESKHFISLLVASTKEAIRNLSLRELCSV